MRQVLAGLALVSCAGAAPRAEPPEPLESPPKAAAPAGLGIRLARGIDPDADRFAYLDGPGFRKSPFFKELMAAISLFPPAREGLDRLHQTCGFDPLERFSSFQVSGNQDVDTEGAQHPFLALRFDVPASRALACLSAVVPELETDSLVGRPARRHGSLWVAVDGEDLLVGNASEVARALSQAAVRNVSLEPDVYLVATQNRDNPPNVEQARLTVARAGTDTELTLTARASTEAAASQLIQQAKAFQRLSVAHIAESDQNPALKELFGHVMAQIALSVSAEQARASLRMPESQASEAAAAVFAALAVYGVKKYSAQAKMAEARSTVQRIAKQVASRVTDQHLARLPKAAPRTPHEVPKGAAVLVPASAWAEPAWRALDFEIDGKQSYAYELEVSADGKRGVVRALGDLDGDGTQSQFELGLTLKAPGYVVLDAQLNERDPDE